MLSLLKQCMYFIQKLFPNENTQDIESRLIAIEKGLIKVSGIVDEVKDNVHMTDHRVDLLFKGSL